MERNLLLSSVFKDLKGIYGFIFIFFSISSSLSL